MAIKGDRGPWIQMWSGRKFYPSSPSSNSISIDDIAHQLSMICRFNGAVKFHYSVAQHSVYVSELMFCKFKPDAHFNATGIRLSKSYAGMVGLLHDAPEAYIGDMVRPLKGMMEEFRVIETLIDAAVNQRFELTKHGQSLSGLLAKCDNIMLMTEKRDVMNNSAESLVTGAEWELEECADDSIEIHSVSPDFAKKMFMSNFMEYWSDI